MPDTWPLTSDGKYFLFEGRILIPVDPTSGAAILMLRPGQDALLLGVPPIAKGDPGSPPVIAGVTVVELEWDDPTPASAEWDVLVPPTSETAGEYNLLLHLHAGRPGEDGDTVLDPGDFDALPGQVLRVDDAGEAFEAVDLPAVEVKWPASIANTASGNAQKTLAVVSFAARSYPRIVEVQGYTVVTGEAPDVRVDLVARLGTGDPSHETGGNIIARCQGITQVDRLQFSPGPAAGAAEGAFVVPAGVAPIVYVRVERQSGSMTFTTSDSTTRVFCKVSPVR